MYEPYAFTSSSNFRQGGIYSYPGNIEFGDETIQWDKDTLGRYFRPFDQWLKAQKIPANRVVMSEFGCMRRNPGAIDYLKDVVSRLEERRYHWAFYAFRENVWDGMDYELGTDGLPWEYWQAQERGENPVPSRSDTPLFDVIKSRLGSEPGI
jgi:hypothetical protein